MIKEMILISKDNKPYILISTLEKKNTYEVLDFTYLIDDINEVHRVFNKSDKLFQIKFNNYKPLLNEDNYEDYIKGMYKYNKNCDTLFKYLKASTNDDISEGVMLFIKDLENKRKDLFMIVPLDIITDNDVNSIMNMTFDSLYDKFKEVDTANSIKVRMSKSESMKVLIQSKIEKTLNNYLRQKFKDSDSLKKLTVDMIN